MSVGASVDSSGDFALWVSDTGVGIAPEDLATVTEVFGQVGDAFSREH
jgi:signal transduction histidine kinase